MPKMFLVVFCSLLLGTCYGQFPRACTDDLSLSTGRCCPLWPASDGTGSPCGEALGRGTCRQIQLDDSPHSPSYPYVGADDRERWPTVYWNWTCECRGNFYGVDCSECKYGYVGPDCNERKILIRRNIFDLSWWDRTRFLRALDESKTTVSERWVIPVTPYVDVLANGTKPAFANVTTYNVLAWMHYYVSRNVLLPDGGVFENIDFAHEGPGFLPWHRVFLLLWERELARFVEDEDFTIPYWDWRDLDECGDVCTDDFLGATFQGFSGRLSNGSVFSDWQVICTRDDEYDELRTVCDGSPEGPLLRNPGTVPDYSTLPRWQDVQDVLKLDQYEPPPYDRSANFSFRNTLEGFAAPDGTASVRSYLHNAVHRFMNGTLSSVGSSANDPLFIIHHAYVDSIYEVWLRKFRPNVSALTAENAPIGHNRGSFMVPFVPLHKSADFFALAADFGYDYDYLIETELAWWEDLGFLKFYGLLVGGMMMGVLLLVLTVTTSRRYCCPARQIYRPRIRRIVRVPTEYDPTETEESSGETETTPLINKQEPEPRYAVVYL
ncbi:tyrosinase-like [Branchiostoma lanceolatum]|uniref:tyrosinase-like n=1 Tax=Branchiostoma lanceolatum TaxID=7740 RepID=UPI0034542978